MGDYCGELFAEGGDYFFVIGELFVVKGYWMVFSSKFQADVRCLTYKNIVFIIITVSIHYDLAWPDNAKPSQAQTKRFVLVNCRCLGRL